MVELVLHHGGVDTAGAHITSERDNVSVDDVEEECLLWIIRRG